MLKTFITLLPHCLRSRVLRALHEVAQRRAALRYVASVGGLGRRS